MESSDKEVTVTVDFQALNENCLDKTNLKCDIMPTANSTSSNNRIIYEKEFLIQCFDHPASSKKPSEFPNLDCTLGTARWGKFKPPLSSIPPKRKDMKEDQNKKDFVEDNISLRPQSGNFSSGCGPSLSPGHVQQHSSFSRFQIHETGKSSNNDYPPRNNYRVNNRTEGGGIRAERGDRDRERDRERENNNGKGGAGDMRYDHNMRGNDRGMNNRRQNHGGWGLENNPNNNNNGNTNWNNNNRRRDNYSRGKNDRNSHDDEPEWFSGGPTSQHDTIELRGFNDDERFKDFKEFRNARNKDKNLRQHHDSGNNQEINNSTQEKPVNHETSSGEGGGGGGDGEGSGFNLERFLKMESIPGISNEIETLETCQSGSSRFSRLFERNSVTTIEQIEIGKSLNHRGGNDSFKETEDRTTHQQQNEKMSNTSSPVDKTIFVEKKKEVQEIESVLRGLLLPKEEKVEPQKASSEELNCKFKQLFQQMVSKENNNENSVKRPQDLPLQKEQESSKGAFDDALGFLLMPQPPQSHEQKINILHQQLQQQQQQKMQQQQQQQQQQILQQQQQPPPHSHHYVHPHPQPKLPKQDINNKQMEMNNFQIRPMILPPNFLQLPMQQIQHQQQQQQQMIPGQFPIPHPPPPQQIHNPNNFFVNMNEPAQSPPGTLTPNQVLALLPAEIQQLVYSIKIAPDFMTRPDVAKVIQGLANGELTLNDVIQQLLGPNFQHRPTLISILKLGFQGAIHIRGLFLRNQGPHNFPHVQSQPLHITQAFNHSAIPPPAFPPQPLQQHRPFNVPPPQPPNIYNIPSQHNQPQPQPAQVNILPPQQQHQIPSHNRANYQAHDVPPPQQLPNLGDFPPINAKMEPTMVSQASQSGNAGFSSFTPTAVLRKGTRGDQRK